MDETILVIICFVAGTILTFIGFTILLPTFIPMSKCHKKLTLGITKILRPGGFYLKETYIAWGENGAVKEMEKLKKVLKSADSEILMGTHKFTHYEDVLESIEFFIFQGGSMRFLISAINRLGVKEDLGENEQNDVDKRREHLRGIGVKFYEISGNILKATKIRHPDTLVGALPMSKELKEELNNDQIPEELHKMLAKPRTIPEKVYSGFYSMFKRSGSKNITMRRERREESNKWIATIDKKEKYILIEENRRLNIYSKDKFVDLDLSRCFVIDRTHFIWWPEEEDHKRHYFFPFDFILAKQAAYKFDKLWKDKQKEEEERNERR